MAACNLLFALHRTIIKSQRNFAGDVLMLMRELTEMVASTADAAFAVDGNGLLVAWNAAAEALFNRTTEQVIGKPCGEVVQGVDECGPVCSSNCTVLQACHNHQPSSNFDLQVPTAQGAQWCNVSTISVSVSNATTPYSVHIVRRIDLRKRLELLVRDFIVSEAKLPPEDAHALLATTRSSARAVELTDRELEVLKLLAKGTSTEAIAQQLHISRVTVNNHIQHLMAKLNAHNRLEAIRRAERAGLI
jgi:DNA-binding CsgD family transcriptional regulator